MSCCPSAEVRVPQMSDKEFEIHWNRKSKTEKDCALLLLSPQLIATTLRGDDHYTPGLQVDLGTLLESLKAEPIMKSGGSAEFRTKLKELAGTVEKQAEAILKEKAGPLALNPLIHFLAEHANEIGTAEPTKIHQVKAPESCVIL